MATSITKSLASRVPIDLYSEILVEASNRGMTISDYLIPILLDRNNILQLKSDLKDVTRRLEISGRDIIEKDREIFELNTTITRNEQRRKHALNKLTNYLEQKGIKPSTVAEIWNEWY